MSVSRPPRSPPLALALALSTLGSSGCESVLEQNLRVLLPEGDPSLDNVDNISLVQLPDGELSSFAVDGLDFRLELDLPDSGGPFSVELFLAKGNELRAWGRSAPFGIGATTPSVFVGRPGELSTFPRVVDVPSLDTKAVTLGSEGELGALLVNPDGETFFFNALTLETAGVAVLDNAEDFDGGAVFRGNGGGALWVSWGPNPVAAQFSLEQAAWADLPLSDDVLTTLAALDPRAPFARHPDGRGVSLYAEAGQFVVRQADDSDTNPGELSAELLRPAAAAESLEARLGGAALSGSDGRHFIAFGGEDSGSLAWIASEGSSGALGDADNWTGAGCVEGRSPEPNFICGGGLRGGQPSSDVVSFELQGETWALQAHPGALGEAMQAPLLWADDTALYAQSDGRLRAFPGGAITPADAVETPAQRHRDGVFFQLSTGATFLVGGADANGAALSRWQVFTPALETQ